MCANCTTGQTLGVADRRNKKGTGVSFGLWRLERPERWRWGDATGMLTSHAGPVIDARKEKASFDRARGGKASVIESRIRRGKVVIPKTAECIDASFPFSFLFLVLKSYPQDGSSTIHRALSASLFPLSLRPSERRASDRAIIR